MPNRILRLLFAFFSLLVQSLCTDEIRSHSTVRNSQSSPSKPGKFLYAVESSDEFCLKKSLLESFCHYCQKSAKMDGTKPKILRVDPTNLTVTLYSETSLQCFAEGNPLPNYRWLQKVSSGNNKVEWQERIRNSTLFIRNVTFDDQGIYKCEAWNIINNIEEKDSSDEVVLDVTGVTQILKDVIKSEERVVIVDSFNDAAIAVSFCSDPHPIRTYWNWKNQKLESGKTYERYIAEPLVPDEFYEDCYYAKLIVKNVNSSDFTNYTLNIESQRKIEYEVVALNIKFKPKISIAFESSGTAIRLHEDAMFLCDADGNPKPRYKWLRKIKSESNDVEWEEVGDMAVIFINDMTYDDRGAYVCKVFNEINNKVETDISDEIMINVTGPPQIFKDKRTADQKVITEEGKDATIFVFFCSVPRPSRTFWSWETEELDTGSPYGYYIAEPIIPDDSEDDCFHARLILEDVETDDSRNYTFKIENEKGRESYSVLLDVVYKPKNVRVEFLDGTTFNVYSRTSFECIAEGNPRPRYRWLKKVKSVSGEIKWAEVEPYNSVLILRNLTYADQGTYVCEAYNIINSKEESAISDEFSIDVRGGSQITEVVTKRQERLITEKFNDSVIKISFCSDPIPRKSFWEWRNQTLDTGKTRGKYIAEPLIQDDLQKDCFLARMIVQDVNANDAIKYTLNIENENGREYHFVAFLDV